MEWGEVEKEEEMEEEWQQTIEGDIEGENVVGNANSYPEDSCAPLEEHVAEAANAEYGVPDPGFSSIPYPMMRCYLW